MKRLLGIVAATVLGVLGGTAFAQTAEDAFGQWADAETGGGIEVVKCGEALCAKISKVPPGKEDAKDIHNEDAAKRDRPLLGLMIVENATKKDGAAWTGTIYDRERGQSFAATLVATNKDTLEITGCKLAILCKTRTLTRVK